MGLYDKFKIEIQSTTLEISYTQTGNIGHIFDELCVKGSNDENDPQIKYSLLNANKTKEDFLGIDGNFSYEKWDKWIDNHTEFEIKTKQQISSIKNSINEKYVDPQIKFYINDINVGEYVFSQCVDKMEFKEILNDKQQEEYKQYLSTPQEKDIDILLSNKKWENINKLFSNNDLEFDLEI